MLLTHIKSKPANNTINNFQKENKESFLNTLAIIKVVLLSFNGLLQETNILKKNLLYLKNKIQNTVETDITTDIIKKEYDSLLNFFSNKIFTYINLELISNHKKIKTLFDNSNTLQRKILLTYTTENGIVVNNSIAIIDNIFYCLLNNSIKITINTTNIILPLAQAINNFTFQALIQTINIIIDLLFVLQKELNKNITLIRESLLLIKTIRKNIYE